MSPAPFRPVRRGPVRTPRSRPQGSGPTLRALVPAVAGLLALLLAALLAPAVAGAHGGPGNLALVSFDPATGQPAGGADYQISVKLTYAGDGDPVDDATVTLSGTSDTGGQLTPVTLTSGGGGAFSGKVALPSTGSWNLTVVSVEPPAQLALEPVTVTTTGGSGRAGSGPSTSSNGAATTEGRVSALEGPSTTRASTPDSLGTSATVAPGAGGDDGSDVPWALLLGAAVVFGLLLLFGVRRYLATKRGTARVADRDGGTGAAPGVDEGDGGGGGEGGDGGSDGGGGAPA